MTKKDPTSVWYKIVTILMMGLNIIVAIGLLLSAYAGMLNPVEHSLAPVVAMTFPFWLIGALICTVGSFFIRWLSALIGLAALFAALPAIVEFSPFNLPSSPDEDDFSFTLMSYNVLGFADKDNNYPGDVNPTLSYILRKDADIVCLQEVYSFSPSASNHVSASQIDSLHTQYPYIYISSHSQAILSKFPVEPINTGFEYAGKSGAADMACFRANVKGRKITIFNVHLQSFDLVNTDREMFLKLTRLQGNEKEIKQMRNHLINKIRAAGPQRVRDTEELIRYIRKFGGPDVIVCGDFNDIPGSYPLRMLADEHLREVYPEVGFGPMITYNSSRFYFRIDHILYRGDFHPVDMTRGRIKSSDHYPVEATFVLDSKK